MPRRKKPKIKYCDACDWETGWEVLHKDNPNDKRLAKDYCEDHKSYYGGNCKAIWCKECGHLHKYLVTKTKSSKNRE